RALAQTPRQARQTSDTDELRQRPVIRPERPTTDTQTTPSAPTTLGRAAKTILALLALFPDQAPPARGRTPLILPQGTNAPGGQPSTGAGAPGAAGSTAATAGNTGTTTAAAGTSGGV